MVSQASWPAAGRPCWLGRDASGTGGMAGLDLVSCDWGALCLCSADAQCKRSCMPLCAKGGPRY